MAVRNVRGAGRKSALTENQIEEVKRRHADGETLTALSAEYGVSRQTLSGYIHAKQIQHIYTVYREWEKWNRHFRGEQLEDYTMRLDYMWREELCTTILVNFREKRILVHNETDNVIHRAFGWKRKPDWEDFENFLAERCFPPTRDQSSMILKAMGLDFYDPLMIIEKTEGRMAEDQQWIQMSYYNRDECGR